MHRLISGFILLCATASASALDVERAQWGFDENVVMGRFNPLWVYVRNSGNKEFKGNLVLERDHGLGQRTGEPIVEPCYVAPGTGRWVLFYPYISERPQPNEWKLTWARGRDGTHELDAPKLGRPTTVFLTPNRVVGRLPASLRPFDTERFPLTVGATGGLRAVVLDQTPDFDEPRRKAFLDWVYGGGQVHVLRAAGEQVRFDGELSELEAPLPMIRVGAGKVFRHDFTRADLTPEKLRELGIEPSKPIDDAVERGNEAYFMQGWSVEQSMLQSLQQLVRPVHNWGLIYLAAIGFLIIVGPLNGVLSRRRLNYQISILVVLLTVAGFSYGFYVVGHSGYGEVTLAHTLGYARPAAPGRLDVTQYSNIFVTRGGRYDLTHKAGHNLYSSAHNFEGVPGEVQNSGGGQFRVTIPIYSSRSFVHNGTFDAPPLDLTVSQWPTDVNLSGLEIQVGPSFPHDPAGTQVWVFYQGKFLHAVVPASQQASKVTSYSRYDLDLKKLSEEGVFYAGQYNYNPYYTQQQADLHSKALNLARLVMVDRLGLANKTTTTTAGDDEQLQVFVLAPQPAAFNSLAKGIGKADGYILYHLNFNKP